MIHLSLYKIRRFLDRGLRLRSACDLEADSLQSTRPTGYTVPAEDELEKRLQSGIATLRASGELGEPLLFEA